MRDLASAVRLCMRYRSIMEGSSLFQPGSGNPIPPNPAEE
jgi:hypothetical protein